MENPFTEENNLLGVPYHVSKGPTSISYTIPQSSAQIVLKLENMLCTTDARRTAYDKIN